MGKCRSIAECGRGPAEEKMSSLLWSFLVGPDFGNPRPLRPVRDSGTRKTYLSVEDDQVRTHLNKPDIHKSMRDDRMHTQVQRELANVIIKLIFTIFQRPRQLGEHPEKQKKVNTTPDFQEVQAGGFRKLWASHSRPTGR